MRLLACLRRSASSARRAARSRRRSRGEPSFSADRFRAHVAFLADDALEGRDTGSRGEAAAAAICRRPVHGAGAEARRRRVAAGISTVRFRSASLTGGTLTRFRGAAGDAPLGRSAATSSLFPSLTAEQSDRHRRGGVRRLRPRRAEPRGWTIIAASTFAARSSSCSPACRAACRASVAAYLGDQKAEMAARRGAIGSIQIYTDRFARNRSPWDAALRLTAAEPAMTWLDPAGSAFCRGRRRMSAPSSAIRPRSCSTGRRSSLRAECAPRRPGPAARPRGFALARAEIRLQRTSAWDAPRPAAR